MSRVLRATVFNILIALALIHAAVPVVAQPRQDLQSWLRINYDGYEDARLKEPITNAEDATIFVSELNSNATLVYPLKHPRSYVRGTIVFNWLNLDLSQGAPADSFPRFDKTIYLDVMLEYRQWYGGAWGWQVRLTPGWSGDLDGDLFITEGTLAGGLWLLREAPDDLIAGVGVARTYDWGQPYFLPSLIVQWDYAPFHVDIEAPTWAELVYELPRNFEIGTSLDVVGHWYSRDRDLYPGLDKPYLSRSDVRVGAGLAYRFDNQLHLRIDGGYAFNRKLRLLDGKDDVVMDVDLENDVFIRAITTWGLDLP